MTTIRTEVAVQFIPAASQNWTDIGRPHASVDRARFAISANEDAWDWARRYPDMEGRPARYRIVWREITETVIETIEGRLASEGIRSPDHR